MTDLITSLEHMRGKGIYINGTTYQVDKDGVIKGIEGTDADKLLASAQWEECTEDALAERLAKRDRLKADFKRKRQGLGLLGADGKPLAVPEAPKPEPRQAPPPPVVDPPPPPTPPAPPPLAKADQPAPSPMSMLESAEEPLVERPLEPAEPVEEPTADEWPDPSMEMSKSYLQDMADAYDVKYHKTKTTKKELVEKIDAAMYGSD